MPVTEQVCDKRHLRLWSALGTGTLAALGCVAWLGTAAVRNDTNMETFQGAALEQRRETAASLQAIQLEQKRIASDIGEIKGELKRLNKP